MKPHLHITLEQGPLGEHLLLDPALLVGCGAVVRFEGVVRGDEKGRALHALRYEVYEPMTTRQLLALCDDIAESFGVRAILLQHSIGVVPVGAVSFRLMIASPHRKEALSAIDTLIDRMKRDVAIWKHPLWSELSASNGEHV